MHRAFKSNQSGQAPAWSIPPIFAKGGYIQLDRRVCQKTKQNTDKVKIKYKEPIVLERSAKLNWPLTEVTRVTGVTEVVGMTGMTGVTG